MSELREDWHDWRYDGRGYYLVNDPEITFQDDAEADAYCDEHNRALVGQAAIRERERIVAWLEMLSELYISRGQDTYVALEDIAENIRLGEHLK